MRTLYYHAGAGAAAAARGLGDLGVRGDDRGLFGGRTASTGAVPRACLAHASARRFVRFPRFKFTSTLR
jgi:hypothetical protein